MEEPFFNEFLAELKTCLQCLFTKGADISIPSFPWSEVKICVADFDNASDVQLKVFVCDSQGSVPGGTWTFLAPRGVYLFTV